MVEVKKRMKKKIIGILVMTLLIATMFPIATGETCPIQWPDQKQTEYDDTGWLVNENYQVAQSFVPTKDVLSQVRIFISKQGDPDVELIVAIREDLSGDDLTYKSINPYFGGENYDWFTFDFDDITVTPGEIYYIIAQADECDKDNCYAWICAEDDNAYPNGRAYGSDDRGQTWESRDMDCCFITYSTKSKSTNTPFLQFLENHPLIYQLLQRFLKL